MLKIDKGIPAPAKRAGAPMKYPLKDMEIGDSFFAPGRKSNSVSASIARAYPKKFTRREVTENGVVGVRVWRIE